MTGQIPPYGEYFRLESLNWSAEYASRRYVYKYDPRYYIRSDHTSKQWWIFDEISGGSLPYRYSVVFPSLTKAMEYTKRLVVTS